MKTTELLKTLIKDPSAAHMNLSNVKGYLGELMVKEKLESEGLDVIQRGNMAGHDLEIPKLGVKIDVKFSTFKSEVSKYPKYWGWALKSGSKKRELKFSHFVLVALKENLDIEAYYIVKVSDLKHFPKNFAQFSKVEKGFGVFPKDLPADAKPKDLEYVKKSRKLLKEGKKVLKVSPSQSLSKALKK